MNKFDGAKPGSRISFHPKTGQIGYRGQLLTGTLPIWLCSHYHPNPAQAKICAENFLATQVK